MKLIINFLANSGETVVTQDWTYCVCVDFFITGCDVEAVQVFFPAHEPSFIDLLHSSQERVPWALSPPNHTALTNFNFLNSLDKAYKALRAFSNRWTIRTVSTSDFGWFMSSHFLQFIADCHFLNKLVSWHFNLERINCLSRHFPPIVSHCQRIHPF